MLCDDHVLYSWMNVLPLSDTDRNVPLGAIAHRAGGWKSAVGSRGKAPVGV